MVVFKDNLCVILDLEGFFINKTFHVRELGYYTWNGEHSRHAFSIPIPYKTLHDKDKRTVNFVCRKNHGLAYQPCAPEIFQDPRILGPLVKDIHQEYSERAQSSEGKRTVVGYKGGHVEKDLLQKLNILSLNLETLGCPKYDDLRSQMVPLLTRPRRSPLLSPSHPPISNPLPHDVRSEGDRGYPPLVTSRQST